MRSQRWERRRSAITQIWSWRSCIRDWRYFQFGAAFHLLSPIFSSFFLNWRKRGKSSQSRIWHIVRAYYNRVYPIYILLCYSFTNRQIEVSSAFESKTEDQDLCRCMPADQSPRIILNVDLYSISLWSSNSTTRQQRKEQRDWEPACRSYQDNSEFHAVRLLVGEEYYTPLSPSWPVFSFYRSYNTF